DLSPPGESLMALFEGMTEEEASSWVAAHGSKLEQLFGPDWRSISFFAKPEKVGAQEDAMPGGPGLRINGLEVWLGAKESDCPLHSKAYRLVRADYRVQVAAEAYRAAQERERAFFWKVGEDGMRVYADAYF